MIRWSYLLPRVAIVAAVVLGVHFGLDRLLRWAMIRGGQRITSAKVEIGSLETSLPRSEIRMSNVRIANPEKPMKNLVEAREVKLALDRDALLKRKYIVSEGQIAGLCFDTDRETSGALHKKPREEKPPKPKRPHDDQLARLAEKWLDDLADILQGQIEKEIDRLQSPRLARELSRRWPAEYDRMEAQAEAFKARAGELRRLLRDRPEELLRNLDATRKALDDVDAIQRDIAQFRSDLDRLRQQALRDRDAIRQAEEHDLAYIRQRLGLDELKGEHLSDFLLGHDLAEKVRTATEWVQWVRRHWPERLDSAEPSRSRGIDVVFPGLKQYPDFLIKKLAIDGKGRMDNQPFQFAGTAEGITSQPAVYGQPTVLKLEVRGPAVLAVEAVLDRTQEVACDRVSIECDSLSEPRRVLGQPERLALAVSPGNTKVSFVLNLRDDCLLGRMTLRQEPIELIPAVADRYGGPHWPKTCREALARIRSVEVVADLSGTLEEPDWRIRSTLGPQLAEAVNWLIQRRELEYRRAELAVIVQQQINGEVARFEKMLQARQDVLLAKVNLTPDEFNQLRTLLGERLRLPDQLLGGPLPRIPVRF